MNAEDGEQPFVEGDHETKMTIDEAPMPKYITAAWVVFLISYAVYFYIYGWPDLMKWGAP